MKTTNLIAGPYRSPSPFRKGDVAFCLYRKADVVCNPLRFALIRHPRIHALPHG